MLQAILVKKINSFTLNTYSADNICIRFTFFLLFGSTHTGIKTQCTELLIKWFHDDDDDDDDGGGGGGDDDDDDDDDNNNNSA